jgi:UDP-N-acetylglucosamine 1-carboxyvinyltransferase
MDSFIITGGRELSGRVKISGSKNTALPLLFSALLFEEEITFENVPRLWDIQTTLQLMEIMGAKTNWNKEEGQIRILPKITDKVAPYEWVRKMRAGILALGPLLARFGEAKVSLPGGCAIGARPVDYHLEAMKKLGVRVEVEEGYIKAQVFGKLIGAEIYFPQVTVTGTENLMMLATAAEGITTIKNAALEPEVVALGEFLISCGISCEGLGTNTITIKGGKLKAPKVPVKVPYDRIEAGTWIAIAVSSRSELLLENCPVEDLKSVIQAYEEMGVKFKLEEKGHVLRVTPSESLNAIVVDTAPFPGFPTDMQAQLLANLCQAKGNGKIEENIFENRFMHVAELRRMGAKIEISGREARTQGPTRRGSAR